MTKRLPCSPAAPRTAEAASLKNIRPQKIAYLLAYTFELLLFSYRGHFFPMGTSLFGIPGKTVVIAVYSAASLAATLMWRKKNKPLIAGSAALLTAGFVPFLFLPVGGARFVCAAVAYAGLGGAVAAARIGYAFALNNAERLLSMILMLFGCAFIKTCDTDRLTGPVFQYVLPLALLAALAVCLLSFRDEDIRIRETQDEQSAKGLYWALGYLIAYFSIDGFNWSLLGATGRAAEGWLRAGMLVSCALFFLLMFVFRRNVWTVWSVFFFGTAAMAVLGVFSRKPGVLPPLYAASGLSLIGWPLSIYTMGCALRRYGSLRLIKKCSVWFVLLSPLPTFADDFAERYFPEIFPEITLVAVLLILFLLLALSPLSARHLFSAEWISDLNAPDMAAPLHTAPADAGEPAPADAPAEIPEEAPADAFAAYGLTPRQREVARLLLAARTRRQIAGDLGVSESTVKTHTAELYKKLGINSRAELFRLFGPINGE